MDNLCDRIMDAIARAVPLDRATITPTSTFDDLGIDSLDVVSIVFEIEQDLETRLPDEFSLSELSDVRLLVRAIEDHLAQQSRRAAA